MITRIRGRARPSRDALAGVVRSCPVRDEGGQAMLLMLAVMVALLAAGMLVFWVGLSTNYATVAQTAADAAALAGEQNVVQQLQAPGVVVNGQYIPPQVDWTTVWNIASKYANDNGATVTELEHPPNVSGFGDDVIVIVSTLKGLPAQSVDAATRAVAEARASVDPVAQPISTTPVSNDASTASGPRFVAHGGTFGFFPEPNANFSFGDEPEIARRLDRLGTNRHLHISGVAGYTGTSTATDAAQHACGSAATVRGLGPNGTDKQPTVTDKQLTDAGLERLVPANGQLDEIALSGTTRGACVQTSSPTSSQPTAGNPNVHLVPLQGGPAGSVLSWPTLGSVPVLGGPWAIPTPIVMCESSGINQPPNSATASGYYQITASTWALYGGPGPAAYLQPKWVQDEVAARIWNNGAGASNWVCAGLVKWA